MVNPETPTADFFRTDAWKDEFTTLLHQSKCSDFRSDQFVDLAREYMNSRTEFPPVKSRDADFCAEFDGKHLANEGCTNLGPVLPREKVEDILEYIKGYKVIDLYEEGDLYFDPSDPPADRNQGYYDLEVAVKAPHLLLLANHPDIVSRVTEFLGATPSIGMVHIHHMFTGKDRPVGPQRFHMDPHYGKYVKLFVYLTDVDLDCGPHVYVKNSDFKNNQLWKSRDQIRQNNPEQWAKLCHFIDYVAEDQRREDDEIAEFYGKRNIVMLTGTAGDGFLVNTKGYHKGLLPVKHERIMCQITYCLMPLEWTDREPISVPGFTETIMDTYDGAYTTDMVAFMNRILIRS